MRVKLDNSYERGGYSERVPERKVHALECWYCSRTDGIKSRTVSSPRRPGQTAGRSYERHLRRNGDDCQSELNADLRQGPQKIDRPGPLILRGAAANGIVQLKFMQFPRAITTQEEVYANGRGAIRDAHLHQRSCQDLQRRSWSQRSRQTPPPWVFPAKGGALQILESKIIIDRMIWFS